MNIIPVNYHPDISARLCSPTIAQNNINFNSTKQKNIKSSHQNSVKDEEEKKHILDLSRRLPGLSNIFNLHHKIGEGSFSSVFLASLKCHDSLPEEQKKLFAIKHLVPTSHPSRIEQELRCLKYIGGCENVVGLDLCMRKYDTVIFVMPYLPHTKFSEYVLKMDIMETKIYMKNLLLALRRVHQFNIIHRDVKPSNFLYDRVNKRFLLVDFGLAQKIDSWPTSNVIDKPMNCNDSVSTPNLSVDADTLQPVGRKRKYSDLNDGQTVAHELEPNAKRQLILQGNETLQNTPLKPLQGDHPKITPSSNAPPQSTQRSQIISPKLASVKRQVLVDNENTIKRNSSNVINKIESVQSSNVVPETNNVNSNFSLNVPNLASYSLSQSTYKLPNYPTNSLEFQKLAQYYNYYNALNYSNFVVNNMLLDNTINSPKTIGYNMYSPHVLHNNFINYNSLYMPQPKIDNNIRYVNQPQKTRTNNVNQVSVALGNLSNQVSVKHESISKDGSKKTGSTMKICGCGGRPAVCSICLGRGAYNAPRAGTQGFRPPEVLLKYTEQTTAVDLWACGVILLSVVSGCYPFFRAPDDLTALAEMVTVFGSKPLKNVATILGRHLMCSHTKRPLDLRKLCSHLRHRALKSNSAGNSDLVKSTINHLQQDKAIEQNVPLERVEEDIRNKDRSSNRNNKVEQKDKYQRTDLLQNKANMEMNAHITNSSNIPKKNKMTCRDCSLPLSSCVCASSDSIKDSNTHKSDSWCGFPDEAFDLLEKLLDLNPHTRITASEALKHPFIMNL